MRLVTTGGGTGGHVFPAVEVALAARAAGAELLYLGSRRGQEAGAARAAGIAFEGFATLPVYRLRSAAGLRAALASLRAVAPAKAALRRFAPDVVFSTGGYAAAPVVAAARSLGVPYVLHEANSVLGRSNRIFVRRAAGLTCVFRAALAAHPEAVRTGQPIRRELRAAAEAKRSPERPEILVAGGSQGSAFLNRLAPEAARLMSPELAWTHLAGRAHEGSMRAAGLPEGYFATGFLDAPEMAAAYARAGVAACRSGGTLAEIALFRLPSVLVPLPTSADGHQLHNAREFEAMRAATVLTEETADPETLASALRRWLEDDAARAEAARALAEWDVPDATPRLVATLQAVARRRGEAR